MAWDHAKGGFNFYRTFVKTDTAWVFAGNSRNALTAATRARAPFESHRSGNVLMKELRAPWIHWHSIDAPVDNDVYAPDDPLRTHPWFLGDDRRQVRRTYLRNESGATPASIGGPEHASTHWWPTGYR
jgi:hypothetical protein